MNFHRFFVSVLLGVCLCGSAAVADENALPQQTVVDPFTKIVNRNKRSFAFARIWEQRYTRDISAELLPFVDDADEELSERALRALGRLEKTTVLSELEKRRKAQEAAIQAGKTDAAQRPKRYFDFDTPIARIESRNLHGRKKIEFVLTHMEGNWTWEKAVEVSHKMKEPLAYIRTPRPARVYQLRHLLEVVDMLYSMSKKGENIQELRRPFLFSKPQNDQLDGAKMTPKQEAEHLLDCSLQVDRPGDDEEYVYGSHLLSLGEPARSALKKRLEQILLDKPKFTHRFPLIVMLHTAARTGDRSYLPLFDRFQKEMTYISDIGEDAVSSKEALEMGLTSPSSPQ